MKLKSADLLRLVGLTSRGATLDEKNPVLLTGAAADPQTGLIVSLASYNTFDKVGNPTDLKLKYWRQLPYGDSKNQNLIAIKTAPAGKGETEISEIWVQSCCVYDSKKHNPEDPEVRKKIKTVLESVSRLNTHLREKGPVENTAKILSDCFIDRAIGENLVIRGLKKEGGFDFSLSPYFAQTAAQGQGIRFRDIDANRLKSALGFSINTLEPDKDFSGTRDGILSTDPQSRVTYEAGVRWNEAKDGRIVMEMYDNVWDAPQGVDATAIAEVLKVEFKKDKDGSYILGGLKCLGQTIDIADTKKALQVLGFARACNQDFANWKYPAFMDHLAQYDLLGIVDPLPVPSSLEEKGGDMLYVSLHGSGFEKVIENFGDQIGIADLFLHRGTKKDGSISSAGVAVDFPFATGGPDSNADGAIPDYLPFWKDIKAFLMTHDHFDHCDGLAYYAKAGLMKEKDVYATAEVKYFLDKKMDFLKVPRRLRPQITVVDSEQPFAIRDEDGNARFWVQGCPNGAQHSARCTPYIVTGCYGDAHYNGSAAVYGDSNGLTEKGKEFFARGTRPLGEMEGVSPEKVDKDITVVWHDPTAIRYEGAAPERDQVESNLAHVLGWFPDKGVLMAPISTNDVEYTTGMNVAHKTKRDITAVGRNAELRISCKNLFGMLPDFDLRDFRLDPFEEINNPDSLIPRDVLDIYMRSLEESAVIADPDNEPSEDDVQEAMKDVTDAENDEDKYDRAYEIAQDRVRANAYEAAVEKQRELAQKKALTSFKEKLPPNERDHEKNVRLFMLRSLFQNDAVVFENDVNDYLMYKAIMDREEEASIRATRTSKLAKSFRINPGRLMIFTTGTQGNAEERFSTFQKFADFFSLLDADESVRNTGYKINAKDFVAVITQPGIVGNENYQENMIRDVIAKRDITVVCAFMDGFRVYNPKDKRDAIMNDLRKKGWQHEVDVEGNIKVYGQPIHFHGHGFRENLRGIVKAIKAFFHECHHIPDYDSYDLFRRMMKNDGVRHSNITPDNFQVMGIDAHAEKPEDMYKKVAQLNPSYVLVNLARKYGHYFGGWLHLARTTLLRREGNHRADGLMARITSDGVYKQKTAQQDWEKVSNPERFSPVSRTRRIGPSRVDRGEGTQRQRGRQAWSITPPGWEAALND